jgi:two-component system chemotaxis response regulator CheY
MAKILIADDSDAIRLVLKDILGIGEHEVIAEAIDGQESILPLLASLTSSEEG